MLQSSLNMLTAESLNRIVSTNESESVLSARGFTAGGARLTDNSAQAEDEFKYILFVWDGIEATSLTKANALAKAVELQTLFSRARDAVMKVLFSGGVIRGKKLQRGSVYVMNDLIEQQRNSAQSTAAFALIDQQNMATFYERILLLKCIVSAPHATQQNEMRSGPTQGFSKLRQLFSAESAQSSYWNRFDSVGVSQAQIPTAKP